MKKYLYDYIKEIDDSISNKKITEDIIKNHIIKIEFFQHERLIHLLVTLFFAIVFIVFVALGFINYIFFFTSIITIILLVFYIIHYFHLENGVQYLYKQYDKMIGKH